MYYLIFLAVAKHNSGDGLEAGRYLKEALDIALPDGIFLPFVDHECMTALLSGINPGYFDKASPSCCSTPLTEAALGANSFAALMELCKRQHKGVNVIKKTLLQCKSPLTPREREVALLAKQRMSAKEIAAKLYISETTVKTTLRNVYGKLDIHSRGELASVEF